MSHTLLQFRGEYYEYGGLEDPDQRGLTIGGHESAYLADLVAAFCLENSEVNLENPEEEILGGTKFDGIYRDDGFVVFEGLKTTEELVEWLIKFQQNINNLLESDNLKFTMVIWESTEDKLGKEIKVNDEVTIYRGKYFPYLDIQMNWNESGELVFGVYRKPNQVLKYLNKGSSHTEACMAAIPYGVAGRLAKLTTRNAENETKSLSKLYPDHHESGPY